MAKPLIVVVGATGTVGSELVSQLLGTGSVRVRALTRDRDKARALGPAVEVVVGDLAQPETLAAAFAGVDKAFVLSNGPAIQFERNAIHAAARAGAKHIVKLSGRHLESAFMRKLEMAGWHLDGEQAVRSTGVPWTILRPQTYTPLLLPFFDRKSSTISLPVGSGKDAFIDPYDIAAVATLVLTTAGHDGRVYELTNADWLDWSEIAEKVGRAVGKPVSFSDVPIAPWSDGLLAAGVPAPMVQMYAAFMTAVKEGAVYRPTGTVQALLGRPPRSFDDWAREHVRLLAA